MICRWCGKEMEDLHGLLCSGPPPEWYSSKEGIREGAENMKRSIRNAVEEMERQVIGGVDADPRHPVVRRGMAGVADMLRRMLPGAFQP